MNRKTAADYSLDLLVYALLAAMALLGLIPFVNVLAKSLSESWAVLSGKVGLLPVDFTLQNIRYVVTNKAFLGSFRISLFVTFAGTALSIFFTAIAAYPLSKKHLPGVKFVLLLYIFTMLFSGGMIANYLLIKQLHLLNSVWSLILPSMLNIFNLLLIKNYFESMPESLEESAKLDGASNLTILLKIIIPLAAPVFATISLFYAVAYWSEWFNALIYISKPALKPLQLYLRDMILEGDAASFALSNDIPEVSPEGIKAASIIVTTVPILLVYPFLQKYFIKGILVGSVKG